MINPIKTIREDLGKIEDQSLKNAYIFDTFRDFFLSNLNFYLKFNLFFTNFAQNKSECDSGVEDSQKNTATPNDYQLKFQSSSSSSTPFNLNAGECGNLGRFFNHRCGQAGWEDGPNMIQQLVYIDRKELQKIMFFISVKISEKFTGLFFSNSICSKPYFAFFAAQDILRGEWLTWNYGYRNFGT